MNRIEALGRIPLFASLPKKRRDDLAVIMRELTVEPGHYVLTEGDPNTSLYMIIRGSVSVTLKEGEKEANIAALGQGECFGEMSLLSGQPASASILTNSECSFYVLEQSDFEGLLLKNPTVYRRFARGLSARLAGTNRDLRGQMAELDKINAHLEDMVAEKTRHLSARNREFQDILTNINQAIFSVAEDGLIRHEYSRMTEALFETNEVAGKDFITLLFPLGNEVRERKWKRFARKTYAKPDDAAALCEKELPEEDFDFEYTGKDGKVAVKNFTIVAEPVFETDADDQDVMQALMLIVHDMTETYRLKEQLQQQARQDNTGEIMAAVSADRESFACFLEEAKSCMLTLNEGMEKITAPDTLFEMYRATHTVKGNCGFLKLSGMQRAAHALEDIFNDAKEKRLILSPRTIRNIEDRVKDLNRQVMKAEECLTSLDTQAKPDTVSPADTAPSQRRHEDASIRVPAGKLKALAESLRRIANAGGGDNIGQLLQDLEELRMVPAHTLFDKYARVIPDLADATGKRATLECRGGDTMIDRTVAESMEEVMIHLVRNCVDHGIESPAVRRRAKKPAAGTVTLSAELEDRALILTIQDDGGGIDAVRVLQRAIEKGEITKTEAQGMSKEDALGLIFRPGFSSKRVATDISGRGVGLDAIADAVKTLGGALALQTEVGKGSTFRISIPRG